MQGIADRGRVKDHRLVCAGFKEQGVLYEHCSEGGAGFECALHGDHGVIVLDIMLPCRDGLSILKGLRKTGNTIPVILLTARNELKDRIEEAV